MHDAHDLLSCVLCGDPVFAHHRLIGRECECCLRLRQVPVRLSERPPRFLFAAGVARREDGREWFEVIRSWMVLSAALKDNAIEIPATTILP